MKQAIAVMKEQWQYFYLTRRLSVYELKSKNRTNYLGSAWEVLNPLIQLMIYWFVFQNVREGTDITLSNGESIPYGYWLISGFILWTFFYKGMLEGSNSIYSRIKMLSKMSFPMSIIPNFVIFSHFYIHLIVLGIGILLFNAMGFYLNIYYLQFLYFIPATLCLLFAIGLITSTLSTIVRDVHMLINAVLRMFLYVSPVLWEIGKLEGPYGLIAKLNPLYYLIEGYRAAFFGNGWYFIDHLEYTLYFWAVTITLFVIGATIHNKFRRHFVDYL